MFPPVASFPHCVHLVLVVEQLRELRHSPSGQLGVVLVVDEVDDGRLELLRRLGQTLHVGHLRRVHLHRKDLGTALQRFWEHSGADPLGSGGDLHLWQRGTSVERQVSEGRPL